MGTGQRDKFRETVFSECGIWQIPSVREPRFSGLGSISAGLSIGLRLNIRIMNHEEAAIKAFIIPNRQERYLGFLSTPKGRAKFTSDLAHFKALDPKYLLTI